jgi:hypothetical protein
VFLAGHGDKPATRASDIRKGNVACCPIGGTNHHGKLSAAKKNAESNKEFGLPEQRKYPMPDASHARNAKARASQMEHRGKLSATDKKKIDAKANRVLGK